MKYTFDGEILDAMASNGWNGSGSLNSEYGDLMIGQPINFSFIVDLDEDWTTTAVYLVDYSPNLVIRTDVGGPLRFNIGPAAGEGTVESPYQYHINGYNDFNRMGFGYSGLYFTGNVGSQIWGFSQAALSGPNDYTQWCWFEFMPTLTEVTSVPEPSTLLLIGLGLVAVVGCRRKLGL
jgi:hypothetical protein